MLPAASAWPDQGGWIMAVTGTGADVPQNELEHHEYHSAVEVDEAVGSWKDWVGPALAVLALVAALIVVVMMLSGVSL
jgi:hypothetical protein